MTAPAKLFADARTEAPFYAQHAAEALAKVLNSEALMTKLVGFAYLGGQPHVACTAVLNFDFEKRTVSVELQTVAVKHAIVERITP